MRLAIALVAPLLLAACVPFPYGPYYRPTVEGLSGEPVLGYCQGQAGPPSGLQVSLAPGIQFKAMGEQPYRQPEALAFTWALDPGRTLRYSHPAPRVSAVGPNAPTLGAWSQHQIEADAVVDAEARSPVPSQPPITRLWMNSRGPADLRPERLMLKLPAIVDESGRQLWPAPPVTLTRDTRDKGWVRYATPGHDGRERSFVVETPLVKVTGRVFIADYVRRPELVVDLQWESRIAGRWRLAAPAVTLRNADAPESPGRQDRLGNALLSSGPYPISLDTPVRSPAGSTRTEISWRLTLTPPYPDRITVELPAGIADGVTLPARTVVFDRRRFDGGMQPFNC